jgi:peptidoglycan/xylan/chitin deacetylase (PgdA/CDA1 family)
MLHRVGIRSANKIPANQNMMIAEWELDWFISECFKSGWSFISLDELSFNIDRRKRVKKVLILTFDDGYVDNYTSAYPLLCARRIPFAVYLTSGFIDGGVVPWWYKLETVLDGVAELVIPDVISLCTKGVVGKNNAFMQIRDVIMSSPDSKRRVIAWLDERYSYIPKEEVRLFMNWSEIQELALSELVTLGAHTHTHPVLSRLEDSEAYFEMRFSKTILQSRIGGQVRHFAYPFGGVREASDREFSYARDLGFETAVTTRLGEIRIDEGTNRFALPRVFVGPGFSIGRLQRTLFVHGIRSARSRCL